MSKLRHFIAGVLLLLLPLQASATLAVCAHSGFMAQGTGSVSAQVVEPCQYGQAADPAQNADQDQGGQSSSSCCASASGCAMCSIAVHVRQFPLLASPLQVSAHFLSAQFTSFIPEGLQRPPGLPA